MFRVSSDLMFCHKDIVNCVCLCAFLSLYVCVCEREREQENAFCLLLLFLITCCSMIFLDHKNHVCHRLLGATS